MRPLFTLPLSQTLINDFLINGYTNVNDLFNINGELDERVNLICTDFSGKVLKYLEKPVKFRSAVLKLKEEETKQCIFTFCKSLDNLLGDGIYLDTILQICGPPGSGKTQLALQLCVSVQIPRNQGGLQGAAIFIDTDCGYSVSRLKEIAEGVISDCQNDANFTVDSILNNIHYLAARDHVQLMAAVQALKQFLLNNDKIKIIIIDNLTFPFIKVSNTLDRTRLIYRLLNQLSLMAEQFNLAVVLTNHLTTKINKNGKYLIPSLGESVSHRIGQQLLLTKMEEDRLFSAILAKSAHLPESVVHFKILQQGLRDLPSIT